MKRHLHRYRPALLALVLAGCASGGAGPAPDAPSSTATRPDAATAAELEAIFRARVERERSRFTQADVDFMVGMIGHHAQAVLISRFAPDNGASPAVRTLAARIINAQEDEIATMQRWLRDRGQAVPEVHIHGTTLMIHGAGDHAHHHHMPGMLSEAQIRELHAARGTAFDRLFLKYMIEHHQGAVVMVHQLFATDGAGQDEEVFKFASDVQVDQTTEVARMERMLAELPPGAP